MPSTETYASDGGECLTGGSADTQYIPFFDFSFVWQTNAKLEITKSFRWNTGMQPLRWYRILGCCKRPNSTATATSDPNSNYPGGCDIIGIQTDDEGCVGLTQQFIHTLVGRNVADICNQLSESRLRWEVCSIKRWTRPADGRLVEDEDQCNILTEVPFQDIPECFPFAIQTDALVSMGMTTITIDTIFHYVSSGGETTTGGSADVNIIGGPYPTTSIFAYVSDGGECLTGGNAETSSSWDSQLVTTAGITTSIEDVEVVFSATESEISLDLPSQFVTTACCPNMPLLLYCHHNIFNKSVLTSFAQRNGLELPSPIILHYSSRSDSWIGHYHMLGQGDDNLGRQESWRFTFEWACTRIIAGDDLGNSTWKFSMLVVRKNEASGLDFDTRAMVVFPYDQICLPTQNLEFDFSFRLNTVTKFINNDSDIVPEIVLLTDNIGLFKSSFWTRTPNFNVRLSKSSLSKSVARQDISSIFPAQPALGITSSSFVTR